MRAKDGIVCAKIGRYGSGCEGVEKVSKTKQENTCPANYLQVNSSVDEAFADRET